VCALFYVHLMMAQSVLPFLCHPPASDQGCQMVCFQTKNPNMGKFWRVLQWKMLVHFMDIWSILQPLGILYGHLVWSW
jgi:hypothetical protein